MADYYIDFDAGSDSNAGTSGSPWKRCPGDVLAEGNASATSLSPGDTVFFKRASVYVGQIRLLASGAPGADITYDGETWGTGDIATFTNNNASPSAAFTNNNVARSNIRFVGLRFYNIGGYAEDDPIWETGITFTADASTNVLSTGATPHGYSVGQMVVFSVVDGGVLPAPLIRSRKLSIGAGYHGYCVKTVPSSTTLTLSVNNVASGAELDITSAGSGTTKIWLGVAQPPGGVGINFGNNNTTASAGSNITVLRCEFDEVGQWQVEMPMAGDRAMTGQGIAFADVSNSLIEDCDFTKVSVPISIKVRGVTESITLRNCTMHDYIVWGVDVGPRQNNALIRNITIEGCTIYNYHQAANPFWKGAGDRPHTDGIFLRSDYIVPYENFVIRGNRFYKNDSGPGTASIYLSTGSSATIYNNIFADDNHSNGAIYIAYASRAGIQQVVNIWNNTFMGGVRNILLESYATPHRVDIRNNVFVRTINFPNVVIYTSAIEEYFAANNAYFNTFRTDVLLPGYQTVEAWKASTGQEAGSFFGDPMLEDLSGPPSGWDVSPMEGSPLIGAGQNLSEFFTADYAGNARPSSGAWDIGAYQFGSEPPPPPPPPPTPPAARGRKRRGAKLLSFFR
jgi:hypothetical protein